MLRHTRTCRELGIPFAADPSQQLARLCRRRCGSWWTARGGLFSNAYGTALLGGRSGWSEAEILRRVGAWVTTHGETGVRVRGEGRDTLAVPAVPVPAVVDPTGVGDAFRAGSLAATAWGVPERCAAQLGCAVAATVLDHVGRRSTGCTAIRSWTGSGRRTAWAARPNSSSI
ncbi:PfkB family carbohydrate kinase [Streptomyces sp. NPDC046324]|uniref:PfkB family carbohydrate kinase n=1 Tax=Streptomyces sp. NPDC046324 TaxID=3154915 RepID=UPI0033CF3CE7